MQSTGGCFRRGIGCSGASDVDNEKSSMNFSNSPSFAFEHRTYENVEVSDFSHLSKAMESLSVEERTMALNDIHGVSELNEEEDLFLEAKLEEMESQLENFPRKQAYDIAMRLNPGYVLNRDFRLIFLRSVEFDAALAAKRIVNHFECKLDMFGIEPLGRDIRLSDFDQKDMIALMSGYHQFLEQRDR